MTITKQVTIDREGELKETNHLGSLQLRHHETNEIILIPTPTNDPNDPLNWSKGYRYYIAIVVCLAMFFCNFLAAGPTVAIVSITEDFFGPPGPTFTASIAKVAYFFTTTALMQGMGMLFWMPAIVKFGRRPVYLASYSLYLATIFWTGFAKTYNSELAGRIVMGLASGAGECLAPLTIADIFFLHERGTVMACYTAALSMGVSGGTIIDGLITINLHWRYIYYITAALVGSLVLLVFFTFPETTYNRSGLTTGDQVPRGGSHSIASDGELSTTKEATRHHEQEQVLEDGTAPPPKKKTYLQSIAIFTGTYTHESIFTIFIRPVALILLPPVLWATLVMSVTIGFLVAISSNFATAFSDTYGFEPYQSGLCFISGLLGSAIGVAFGGHISDWTADYFTRRNGGRREPEMRLPSLLIGGIFAPIGLLLYGFGIDRQLHWIVPTLGLGFLSFAIVQATNVSLVYTIDSYRPAAGEVTVAQLSFKAAFGFLLSFYTNPWIAESGYAAAFGAMAGISLGVILLVIPIYIWGKQIRHATWHWTITKKYAHWDDDREVGE